MPHMPRYASGRARDLENVRPDLAELCRMHDISLDLIERSKDLDDLLSRVLDEYERRLLELPPDALELEGEPLSLETAKRVRALVMFASQAVALKERAEHVAELEARAEMLEKANAQLGEALGEAERARNRLGGVLSAVDTGILILSGEGTVLQSNRAACDVSGIPLGEIVGRSVPQCLGDVPRGGDGEVVLSRADDGDRFLLVARRDLAGEGEDAEVVLLSDVTERRRELEKQHELEKLQEIMRTLSVLSHKINNPLTSLMGRAQLLQVQKTDDPKVTRAASVIENSAQRIAELVQELGKVVKGGRREAVDELLNMHGLCGDEEGRS